METLILILLILCSVILVGGFIAFMFHVYKSPKLDLENEEDAEEFYHRKQW